jgi:hypothetical protein
LTYRQVRACSAKAPRPTDKTSDFESSHGKPSQRLARTAEQELETTCGQRSTQTGFECNPPVVLPDDPAAVSAFADPQIGVRK